ncbi:MAG: hypothetical protein ABJB69_09725 [Spartobacteria bacterium]
MAVAASLHNLLTRSLDYAGMFPPCSLELAPALANQARYVRDAEAWMLSAFVLPIAKFAAASPSLSQFDREHPLRVSALVPKSNSAPEFIAALRTAVETIRTFSKEHVDLVSVDQLEMPLNKDVDLAEARGAIGDLKLRVFWETTADAAAKSIASLAGSGFGYKLRTGGVTPDAFPSSAQIAKALVAAAKHQVPIKFTAGLHHPVRQFRDEVKTKMHGFLNVLGAGVLAFEHKWDEAQTTVMLEDEDAAAYSFDDKTFAWREWKIDNHGIEAQRKFVTSFGSCSFDEPREDLRALKLL